LGSYGQWAKRREPRRVTWVCGTEPVLVEDVVAAVCASVAGRISLTAGADREADIWAALSSPLADPGDSVAVIVRDAHKLRSWDQLPAVVASRELDAVKAVLVSGEARLAQVPGEDKPSLAPHLAALRDSRSGQLVECRLPEDWKQTPDWVMEWADRQLGGPGPALAGFLLAACGGRLEEAAAVAVKLRLAGLPPSRELIAVLADLATSFAESLIAGRPKEALAAAASLTPEATGRAIGLLASRLEVLAALRTAVTQRLDARDTAVKLGVAQFLQVRYKSACLPYGPARVDSCRMVLAMADEAWRSGAVTGVAEFIAVLWQAQP
jgi:hypothetical protein